jgi:hypothetical protein
MDCLDAQASISEALDGATSDAAKLDAAKQHCRDCAECGAFVRSLTLIKRAGLPEPPVGLADSVMDAVRKEAAEKARVEAAVVAALPRPEAADAGASEATDASGAAATAAGDTTVSRLDSRRRIRPAALAAWVGAAAIFLVGIGTIGVLGVRLMSPPPKTVATGVVVGAASTQGGAGANDKAALEAAPSAPASATERATVSATSDFVTFKGTAYRLAGPATVDGSQLKPLGTTTTSLDGGNVRSRPVQSIAGSPSIYVASDSGQLLELQPLERAFQGRTYRLSSADIVAFGVWPTLPAGIAQPTSADGSPTFLAVGTDSAGVTIYRRTSSPASEGIAVAPGAPEGDSANGIPGWSWWTPIP